MSLDERINHLRDLVRLINDASEVVIHEWQAEAKDPNPPADASLLPSQVLYDARRTLLGACGMASDLVAEPQQRLMEVSIGYYSSRALHVAAEGRVADIIAEADTGEGVHVSEIASKTGVEHRKLARILRALCSIHIFKEVKELHFANTQTSQAMAGNDPLRCWLLAHGMELYTASAGLLNVLFDPARTGSYAVHDAAFNDAHGSELTFWEFLEQREGKPDAAGRPSRGLEIFSLAMVGGGRVHAPPLYADYPWAALGKATIVDVGGGVGGMSLELAKRFPDLNFVVQDRAPVIEKAKAVWAREVPDVVASGRITFLVHDFFTEQPVKGAEVYLMRHIIHDWPDAEARTILAQLASAMSARSRILTVDQVVHTTRGSKFLAPAPAPLPANYGHAHVLAHHRDMNMLANFNAQERRPEDLEELGRGVGLRVGRVWECRGMMAITEIVRSEVEIDWPIPMKALASHG
ncbi:hypothetical protein FOMPIDRAFT_1027546 [Fomitopsis schrenkii]|uniref:Uncharacterized protein n=1 Tax=Fomitopsis schrenkii TaxID=2126942 RepID=S8EP39_FOMSC|nr:hypothetical protein FOMPIDRAFT_1027546 [Fomitopsis schrenkii]